MRWIVRSVMALFLFLVLAVGAVFMIPAEKIAGLTVAKFNALTGRELVILGSVRPSVWPQLGVKTGAVSMSNAEWSDEGPMLQAEGLEISVDMAALMGGVVKITAVEAIAPRILLERSAKGQENWMFGGSGGGGVTTDTPGVGQPFTIDSAVFSDGALTFIDHGAGTRVALSQIEATVAIPDYIGAAQLDLAAVLSGQAFSAAMTVGAFQKFLDGKVVPLDLKLRAGAADIAFAGRAGHAPMEAEGDLTASLGDLAAVAALAGAQAPALPEGMGARDVRVTGALTVTSKASLHLRKGAVVLDGNSFAMDADLTTEGDRPKLSATVTAGTLDLAAVSGGEGGGSGGGAGAAGWPRDSIDVSGLAAMDAAVAVTADSLDLGMIKLGATQMMVTIDRARAVFDIRKTRAYEGTISGNFVVNGRKGLSVGGDLAFADMALQPMLADLGGYRRVVGTGDLRVKFLGVGNSVDAIMQGLEGSGTVSLTKGEILGLDIPGMLRTLDTAYVGEGQKTIFDSLAGSFVINSGVLRNDDLRLTSPYITAMGAGDVGLGARNLEYRVKATAMADDAGAGGLTAPLLIKGPWADPKFSLDLESLAQDRLDLEKDKLEAELRAKADQLEAEAQARADALEAEARAKLESELGVVQQNGESLEDAARRRAGEALEDEARKALEDILNGN